MSTQRHGYHELADFMAWEPSLAIFSRFKSANLLCLLHMQAEIADIEEDLGIYADTDFKSDGGARKEWLQDWSKLGDSDIDERQRRLLKLRALLAEYNQALSLQIELQSKPGPRPKDLKYLQYWMDHPSGGAGHLRGPGCTTWDLPKESGREDGDLISLDTPFYRERMLTQWLLDVLWLFMKILPKRLMPAKVYRRENGQIIFAKYGSTARWQSLADQISCFIATVLILVPVITLHFLESPNTRLIVIVVFSLAFQGAAVLMTEATRSEIFAATAAFVAIQVIYVGSALVPRSGNT